jgi:hypothetical protein
MGKPYKIEMTDGFIHLRPTNDFDWPVEDWIILTEKDAAKLIFDLSAAWQELILSTPEPLPPS